MVAPQGCLSEGGFVEEVADLVDPVGPEEGSLGSPSSGGPASRVRLSARLDIRDRAAAYLSNAR